MITHKHLRTVIEDIYLNGNEITENLLLKLINEFRYSNLYIPAKRSDGELNFIIYEDEGMKFTPLFTDLDEFHKFFKEGEIEALNNTFELYQNILKTTEIEGYILNPSSEKYLFKKEFILSIKDVPKTFFYSNDPYTSDELKKIMDSINNSDLEEFIKNRQNIGDYEGLFERLSNSDILTLMVSDIDLKDRMVNGIVDMQKTGPLAGMFLDNVGGVYATIFSAKDKIQNVKTPKFKYAQIVNLATLVNFVLTEDMDGIVLNPESDNVLIPRSKLLNYSLGFERFANDEKLSASMYYLFEL
ncbi:MAG: SseB family protein [Methanobrevibacter sp.]|uniref:SseB family protein n=1 Tax=Methanobrevibacter sp. TaxID=66852 RepID=UPI0025EDFDA9|nr:SseB family protein [Methanobrevibacter sp.]MBQ6100246.1 SseB family protein [Methanobrevibacter sp.]